MTESNHNRRNQFLKVGGMLGIVVLILLAFLYTSKVKVEVQKSQCLRCHSEFGQMSSWPYPHTAFVNEACQECHTPHGQEKTKTTWVEYVSTFMKYFVGQRVSGRTTIKSYKAGQRPKEVSKLIKTEKELCNDCHEGKRFNEWKGDKYKHPPYKKGTCTSCHDAHASRYIGVVREEPATLCVSCHNVAKQLRKEVLHPPFKKKRCADCHEPHASNSEAHLRLPQKELCRVCHPQIAQLFKLKYQMEPFEKGQCTKCHDPHSSKNKHLLKLDQDVERYIKYKPEPAE